MENYPQSNVIVYIGERKRNAHNLFSLLRFGCRRYTERQSSQSNEVLSTIKKKARSDAKLAQSGRFPQSFPTNCYFLSVSAGGTAPGKMPSSGARFFSSRSGCGSGLRGSIWSRCAAL